jgi:membrane glycosyltransferase
MIQTAPTIVNRESLFARVQQFASRVYGPLFTASLHFWQLGESYYWGHNAIIRVDAFVEHCGLARSRVIRHWAAKFSAMTSSKLL